MEDGSFTTLYGTAGYQDVCWAIILARSGWAITRDTVIQTGDGTAVDGHGWTFAINEHAVKARAFQRALGKGKWSAAVNQNGSFTASDFAGSTRIVDDQGSTSGHIQSVDASGSGCDLAIQIQRQRLVDSDRFGEGDVRQNLQIVASPSISNCCSQAAVVRARVCIPNHTTSQGCSCCTRHAKWHWVSFRPAYEKWFRIHRKGGRTEQRCIGNSNQSARSSNRARISIGGLILHVRSENHFTGIIPRVFQHWNNIVLSVIRKESTLNSDVVNPDFCLVKVDYHRIGSQVRHICHHNVHVLRSAGGRVDGSWVHAQFSLAQQRAFLI